MTDARDPVLRRAIDELRRLPAADPEAMRRVVRAAAAARVTPADEPMLAEPIGRPRFIRWWAAAGLIAAAAIIGFVARGAWISKPAAVPATAMATVAPGPVQVISNTSPSDVVAIPEQFLLRNTTAHRVAIVGDFNQWNPSSAPMTRSSDGALWSAIVPILPGRHLYGFMIDDSLFVLDPDPRAPRARDPDLGSEGSVRMVGRP